MLKYSLLSFNFNPAVLSSADRVSGGLLLPAGEVEQKGELQWEMKEQPVIHKN